MRTVILAASFSVGAGLFAAGASAQDFASLSDDAFFTGQVLPVLEETCFRCHDGDRQRGGLRLDSRGAALRGGDSGAVVVPGDPEASRLVRAIRREGELAMPPKKDLDPESVAILTEWVRRELPWPATAVRSDASEVEAETRAREVPAVTLAVDPGAPIRFDRDIRPILSDKCFACHGPDAAVRKAHLRFDTEDGAKGALPSGRRAVVPGDLAASQLIQRIAATDPEDRMPPADFHKSLSRDEIERLARWVLQGAPWQGHWSFEPPTLPDLPRVANGDWPRNPIDTFVLARLESEELEPSPEAERRRLLRRATLDLTGLPPTPEEIDRFLRDTSPDAYEKQVDRLLSSPHYGEHMARYWLDAARYADTNGYHIDNRREMWRWRDWVIAAFNENKPFDAFTVEQLAGDLLPDPTTDQLIATGFNRNHMINFEGGAIPEEYRTQYVMDRLDTTATVWMGLTMHCAQCHDHKYDPISQREFYEMAAYFNTVAEEGLDGREGNAKPKIPAPLPDQKYRLEQFEARAAAVDDKLKPSPELEAAFEMWLLQEGVTVAGRWTPIAPASATSEGGATLEVLDDASIRASGENPDTDVYSLTLPLDRSGIGAIRFDALRDGSLPEGGPGRASNGNFVLTEFEAYVTSGAGEEQRVPLARVFADHNRKDFLVSTVLDGDAATGWSGEEGRFTDPRTAIFVIAEPLAFEESATLRIRLAFESQYGQHAVGRFRVSVTSDPAESVSTRSAWRRSGPYAGGHATELLAKRFEPERAVEFDATDNFGRLVWTRFTVGDEDEVERPTTETSAWYAAQTITAPTARVLHATMTTPLATRVWVNGDLVHEAEARRDEDAPANHALALPLVAGENTVLVKLVSRRGAFAFNFTIDDEASDGLVTPLRLALAKSSDQRLDSETSALREHFMSENHPHWDRFKAQQDRLAEMTAAIRNEIPTVMVMSELEKPRPTFILTRGQYDQPAEQVSPATPDFLPPLPKDAPPNRLALAQWLVNPDHPLTARVTVNRFWQQFFGRGLVETPEDFGTQGSRPTHPELLDWLAVDFVENDWDVKRLVRQIVTSATYRQSARRSPKARERDPRNLLLAGGPRFRLDAEVVRDQALAVSGLLVDDIGGPSVSPYQPPDLWKDVAYGAGFTAQVFERGEGDELYRRSMYTFWKRTSPPPSMMIFDAPNRETCTVGRPRSNSPMQALVLMNDDQFVEAARAFAERILTEAPASTDARIAFAFEAATARPPDAEERAVLEDLYEAERARFAASADAAAALLSVGEDPVSSDLDPIDVAAWTVIASTILNLDETITKG